MNSPEILSTNLSTFFLPSPRASGDGRKTFIFGPSFMNGQPRKLVDGRKVGRTQKRNLSNGLTPFSTILPSKVEKKKEGKTSTAGGIRARERQGRTLVERKFLTASAGEVTK